MIQSLSVSRSTASSESLQDWHLIHFTHRFLEEGIADSMQFALSDRYALNRCAKAGVRR